MDETNGHAHENEDSGSLNDRTKIEMLTAKRATYSVEEQHTIQKEALWRKRWPPDLIHQTPYYVVRRGRHQWQVVA